MRILQLVPEMKGGGGEWLAVSLHQWMVSSGVDSKIVSLAVDREHNPDGPGSASFLNSYCKSWWRLYRLCRRFRRNGWKPDVVHAHMYPSQLLAGTVIARFWPTAALSTTEHSTSNRRRNLPFGRALDSRLFRRFVCIVCVSQATKDAFSAWQPELAHRLRVIPNGINVRSCIRRTCTHGHGRIIVISVGRLEPVKNYITALSAIAMIKDLPVEYWIVGKGRQEGELRQLSRKLGIAQKVRFLGWRDDIPDVLRQADIFFMPSLWEGFGLTLVQGMATGLPVVASDIPAVREVVGPAECAHLAQPADAHTFATALRGLAADPGLRLRNAEEASRRARDFDFDLTAHHYHQLFSDLSQGRR